MLQAFYYNKTTGYAGGQSLSVIMLKKVPFDLE